MRRLQLARECVRRKSFGNAMPCSRSCGQLRAALGDQLVLVHRRFVLDHRLQPRLQAGFHELVEIAVEHGRGVAHLDVGAQILDARLVEHVGADLVAPAHVGLGILEHLRRRIALVHLELVELGLEHLHRGGAVLVLAALVLAGHDDARGQVAEAHRRLGLVHVLAAGAAGADTRPSRCPPG